MKKTQLTQIKHQLLSYGEVSRNWGLRNQIARMASRILDLKKEGWVFETETRGGDYVYIATLIPMEEQLARKTVSPIKVESISNQLTLKI
jgi:hypothetical protein